MTILRAIIPLLLSVAPVASAQMPATTAPDRDAADSAATARNEYRAARESLMKGDTATALEKLASAARAWPLQPVYPNALLELAIRARDEKRVRQALDMGNNIGVALGAAKMAPAASQLKAAIDKQNELGMSISHGTEFRTLKDSTLFPEALSIDPRNGTMYVSSVRHRNVLVAARDGSERMLLRDKPGGVGALFGIAVDTMRGLLWAASAPSPAMMEGGDSGSAVASLLAIRLNDGTIARRIAIPTNVTNASPGDLALSSNGDVLLSDSQAGVLWWLRASSDSLIPIRHHLFRSLQGIVPAADGKVAWVADYSHGLLRVELATAMVQRVADLAGHTSIGLDGMVRYGDTFVAVQNGFNPMQVVRIKLDASGTRVVEHSVIDRNVKASSPTGGVIAGDNFVYVANSLWEMLDDSGKLTKDAKLPRPLLLQLRLRR